MASAVTPDTLTCWLGIRATVKPWSRPSQPPRPGRRACGALAIALPSHASLQPSACRRTLASSNATCSRRPPAGALPVVNNGQQSKETHSLPQPQRAALCVPCHAQALAGVLACGLRALRQRHDGTSHTTRRLRLLPISHPENRQKQRHPPPLFFYSGLRVGGQSTKKAAREMVSERRHHATVFGAGVHLVSKVIDTRMNPCERDGDSDGITAGARHLLVFFASSLHPVAGSEKRRCGSWPVVHSSL